MQKTTLPNEGSFPVLETEVISTESISQGSFMARLAPKFLREVRDVFKKEGMRGAVRRYGWKLFAAFFAYYLVRDSIIYLLVPYLIAKGVM
ncbi:MAG: hypothetical protein ACXWQO_18480 [Bdellovibrionota bacterium]